MACCPVLLPCFEQCGIRHTVLRGLVRDQIRSRRFSSGGRLGIDSARIVIAGMAYKQVSCSCMPRGRVTNASAGGQAE
eukprot:365571-Chlamydomonas_euryale.AAC.4